MLNKTTHFQRKDLFGGTGTVDIFNLQEKTVAPPFKAVLWCVLEPGGNVGRHRQQDHPEIIVGIAGEGETVVNGQAHPLGEGSLVYLPFGATLAITNSTKDTPLTYLIIKASQAS